MTLQVAKIAQMAQICHKSGLPSSGSSDLSGFFLQKVKGLKLMKIIRSSFLEEKYELPQKEPKLFRMAQVNPKSGPLRNWPVIFF